jgi:hypothetical protein
LRLLAPSGRRMFNNTCSIPLNTFTDRQTTRVTIECYRA